MDAALITAVSAARRAGLDPTGARVIRRSNAVLVELPAADAVARVEVRPEHAARQREVARAFAELGAPTMRTLDATDAAEPERVTLWERLREGPPMSRAELGGLARELHGRSPASLRALPTLDPFEEIEHCLRRLPAWLGAETRRALEARAQRLQAAWREDLLQDPLGRRLIHGDVHRQNVMWRGDRRVFVDLEWAGVGPASWDLVPQAVHVRRYGCPMPEYEAFLRTFGVDPAAWSPWTPSWPGFARFCEVYELICVVWTLANCDAAPRFIPEARIRLASLSGGEETWTLT